jgi:hypothetical protein
LRLLRKEARKLEPMARRQTQTPSGRGTTASHFNDHPDKGRHIELLATVSLWQQGSVKPGLAELIMCFGGV